MSTNTNLLKKAILHLGVVILLFITSPIILTMGFKGVQKLTGSPQIYLAYLLIVIGFIGIIFSIYFAFKSFSILKKALFYEA